MAATAWNSGCRAIIATSNAAVEDIPRQNERLRVPRPTALDARPTGAGRSAIAHASAHAAAVVAFEETQARSSPHRINAGKESITAQAFLPLHGTSRATA